MYGRKTLQSFPGFAPWPLLAAVLLVGRILFFFSMGKWMSWTRALCILCTDSQQMLGNNLWSFNCMDCIAAAWRPSARIPRFSLWNSDLYILDCSCADGCLLKGTAAGGFRTFTWANKRANSSQTWLWPCALVVSGLLPFSFPSILDSQGWGRPWNVISARCSKP